MKMPEIVKSYIEKNQMISQGDTIIVGLSGGADSVCLFHILLELRQQLGIDIIAVHVNHGIRGEAARSDEDFVKNMCEQSEVECKSYVRDIPKLSRLRHESEEECGRHERYEIFSELASEYKNAKIAVAHHMDDQAETALFRMVRGTGVKGIGAMKPVAGNIIRPLLCVTRREILEYIEKRNLAFRTDATNEDINYSRNYLRKVVIPDLCKLNSEAVAHISLLCEDADALSEYVEDQARKLLIRAGQAAQNDFCEEMLSSIGTKYNSEVLLEATPILRQYSIRMILSEAGISLKDVTREHIQMIESIMKPSKALEVNLPRGVRVISEGGNIYIASGKNQNQLQDFLLSITDGGEYILPDGKVLESDILRDFSLNDIPMALYTKWFDYDKIQDGLCVRTRREGDYIIVNSAGGRKRLKDYFIDEKIPKSQRDSQLLLARNSQIIWVIGHRISEDVKVSESTDRVLRVTITGRGCTTS